MPRKIVARRSAIHGTGVFASMPIAKGERIIEYTGRIRTHAQVDRGSAGSAESGHTFLFTLNDKYVIDGTIEGNVARWINHSCAPNCEAVLEEDADGNKRGDRVFIEARKSIKPGDELSYNYGITLGEPHTARMKKIWECRCGAKKCTGTMLQPKRKPKAAATTGTSKAAKSAKQGAKTVKTAKRADSSKVTKSVKTTKTRKTAKASGQE